MGKMESESKKRARRNQIRRIILETVKVAGILTVAVAAPNVIGAMAKVGLIPHPRQQELIRRSVDRMYAQGYLKHERGKLQLTAKGERHLHALTLKSFQLKKPRRWDRKWRILIFDIPEKQRRLRESVRRTLIGSGFLRVQHSVWAYPYDCEDWVNLWKAELKIGKELLYLVVDSMEESSILERKFRL